MPVDHDGARLPKAMGPSQRLRNTHRSSCLLLPLQCHYCVHSRQMTPGITRLHVVVRVPVRVEDEDGVCCCQIDALPAGPRGQQEHVLLGARGVEGLDALLPLLAGCTMPRRSPSA